MAKRDSAVGETIESVTEVSTHSNPTNDVEVAAEVIGRDSPRVPRSAHRLVLVLLFLLACLPGFAMVAMSKDAQPAEDPRFEQRMRALTQQLRCMVCQNETLADSQADLAADLRREMSEQMKAGRTDQEIVAFLTQRYGDKILYNPPVKATTYLLWFGPFVLLLAATALLYRYVKRRRDLILEKPLTTDERNRAEELLRTDVG